MLRYQIFQTFSLNDIYPFTISYTFFVINAVFSQENNFDLE